MEESCYSNPKTRRREHLHENLGGSRQDTDKECNHPLPNLFSTDYKVGSCKRPPSSMLEVKKENGKISTSREEMTEKVKKTVRGVVTVCKIKV